MRNRSPVCTRRTGRVGSARTCPCTTPGSCASSAECAAAALCQLKTMVELQPWRVNGKWAPPCSPANCSLQRHSQFKKIVPRPKHIAVLGHCTSALCRRHVAIAPSPSAGQDHPPGEPHAVESGLQEPRPPWVARGAATSVTSTGCVTLSQLVTLSLSKYGLDPENGSSGVDQQLSRSDYRPGATNQGGD